MAPESSALLQVFIENEAGSYQKKTFDEHTLEHLATATVSMAYPFPYGFVQDTVGDDGAAVDCFVLTANPLRSGMVVACRPIALLEKIEDGAADHKVIALPAGVEAVLTAADETALRAFIAGVFAHVSGKATVVGRMLGPDAAAQYVARSRR